MDINYQVRMEPKNYSPAGRCIYCGTTAGKLTDEHIIARSIGGAHVIPKASCKSCADQTLKFEGICARETFEVVRSYAGLASKKLGKRETLTISTIDRFGQQKIHQVGIDEHPSVFAVPLFPDQPGAIAGKKPGPIADAGSRTIELVEDAAARTRKLTMRFQADVVFNRLQMVAFGRMLAKIAIGYAYADEKMGDYYPVVNDLVVRSDERFIQQYMFTDARRYQAANELHQIKYLEQELGQHKFLLVGIRLFSIIPASPVYYVMVGSKYRLPKFPEWTPPGEKENLRYRRMFE